MNAITSVIAENWRQQGILVVPFMDSVRMEPKRLQPHYHEFFQLFFLEGRAAVMHDFVEFHVEGSSLFFMSPGQIHTANPEPGLRGTTVSFTQDFFDHHAPPPSQLFEFPYFLTDGASPWLQIPRTQASEIASLLAEMQREFDSALSGAATVLRALLHLLLVRAGRMHAECHPPRSVTRAAQVMRQFRLAVEQHFREWHQVEPYARLLEISPNHLHDLVREQSGHAAGEIIRERRLLDAKRLLLHSDLDISEIGYHLGFKDPSYFGRFFRKAACRTPAQFREEIREKYQQKPL